MWSSHVKTPSLVLGIVLGFGAAVPIGPVNVELARRVLRSGFGAGLALGLGAVSADVTYVIVSRLFSRLIFVPRIEWVLSCTGALLLMVLGLLSIRALPRHLRADPVLATHAPPASAYGGYLTGLAMTLLNPMTLAFWFTVVPGTTGTITKDARHDLPMICAGVLAGTVAWVGFFAAALSRIPQRNRKLWLAAADGVGGMVLLGFAAAGLWHAVHTHL